MLDFVQVSKTTKKGRNESVTTIAPTFVVGPSKDLMIRGGHFYAFYDERNGMWNRNLLDIVPIIDGYLYEASEEYSAMGMDCLVKSLSDFATANNSWTVMNKYLSSLPDSYVQLDSKVLFSDSEVGKDSYATKRLPYSLSNGSADAYDELMGVLYDDDERMKFEWGIGSIFDGSSRKLDKMYVFYGEPGTGKSTVLRIIEKLFEGYTAPFRIESLVTMNDQFALSQLSNDSLVLIEHDANVSRIESNTKLNSVVSHENLSVNEKFAKPYEQAFYATLFIGTNSPVKITDSKSGLLRRLIDIYPTGDTVSHEHYNELVDRIQYELGSIAKRCIDVFRRLGPHAYDAYEPYRMSAATDPIYDFVRTNYELFTSQDGTCLRQAWELWKGYLQDSMLQYSIPRNRFKENLRSYFRSYEEGRSSEDFFGYDRPRNVYLGFRKEKFLDYRPSSYTPVGKSKLKLEATTSILDDILSEYKAQYANEDGTPSKKWANVNTKLKDIDTRRLHYVMVPKNHIVIDFDLKNEEGDKDLDLNLEAAAGFPETYAEVSQGGKGIHLHYVYDGDVDKLSNFVSLGVECKVYSGKSALRRRLTKCNNIPVKTISGGLPLRKEGSKVIDFEGFKNEKSIRTFIARNLNKEYHPGTKPSIEFIYSGLENAYSSGMKYDVSDLKSAVFTFASRSTHHADYCTSLVMKMKFSSEEERKAVWKDLPIAFFDVEVFPNFFLLCVLPDAQSDEDPIVLPDPSPEVVTDIVNSYNLVGFNNRRYDNHILYGRMLGYSNKGLYQLSKDIVENRQSALFREAYSLSYADIYDFSSKKQSLKKFEIDLGIHHVENEYPWDKPLSDIQKLDVIAYCKNDVIATKSVFHSRKADFTARKILSALSGKTVNDSTRNHAAAIIFEGDSHPQSKFIYTDLSEMFPGYYFEMGKSHYRGEEVGEGGYVYAEPGIYESVVTLDVESMHPTSIIQLNLFGPYTKNFKALVDARLAIKHKSYDAAREMFDGKLAPYLKDDSSTEALSYALKIVINSVYGLTAAHFDCPFKDPRNIDNIVAKRGALFMVDLKNAVKDLGYDVVHIKTDSIKIPKADEKVIAFVTNFGEKYGYKFDIESEYEKFCLVNDAVYVAKEKETGKWTATGAQFQEPYVFKTIFSHEPVEFNDFVQTKSVSKGSMYLAPADIQDAPEESYKFVGRVGTFVPVLPPRGNSLVVQRDEKYSAVTGTKGYRWDEAEPIRSDPNNMDYIDKSYYENLKKEAIEAIENFGDFEKFVS